MKKMIGLALAASAFATHAIAGATYQVTYSVDVPEVGSTGAVAALAAVTAVGVMAWERRRRNK